SETLHLISLYKNLKDLSCLLLLNAKKFVEYRRNEGANILTHIKNMSQIKEQSLNKELGN
ncbi:hypothetical protein PCANB_001658, partial [Pneumocystis canis]